MRKINVVLLLVLISISYSFLPGQMVSGGSPDSRMTFGGLTVANQKVKIDYSIPFGGVVELHLFDGSAKRVWYDTYATDRGDHSITLNQKAFKQGEVYTYVLKYKLSEYRGALRL